MFCVYNGKFFGAIDRKPDGFIWSIRPSNLNLPDDDPPIAEGTAPTMQAAVVDAYEAGLNAAHDSGNPAGA